MKNKILMAGIAVSTLAIAGSAYAVAQTNKSGTGAANQIQQQTQTANQGEDIQIQTQTNQQTQSGTAGNQVGTGTGTQAQQQIQEQLREGDGAGNQVQNQNRERGIESVENPEPALYAGEDETDEELPGRGREGQTNAEQHRSAVANFVQGLLQVAERDGGIGEQVRTVAQEQNQSASTTIKAMEKVQTRSRVKTFFFGTDYKNLGTLRSEMVQTRNRLEQLNRIMVNVQNEGDKTELQNQIQTLEQEQARMENFIKEQEGKFSLFGWLVKFFSK